MVVFFKQKTAYEMRISDGSSDVCSSDLFVADLRMAAHQPRFLVGQRAGLHQQRIWNGDLAQVVQRRGQFDHPHLVLEHAHLDRKSVVSGKSVSVRVDIGGRRIIQKNNQTAASYTT